MKSKRRSGEGGEEGQSISCSIWNSRARRSVECVPCAARLAKDSWRTREIKGSHSFFRGKRKREIRAWRHDCLPNSKSHPPPPLYNNLSLSWKETVRGLQVWSTIYKFLARIYINTVEEDQASSLSLSLSRLLKSLISTVCYCLYGARGGKERDTSGRPRCRPCDPDDSRASLSSSLDTRAPHTCPHFWFPFKHVSSQYAKAC